jgi:hypothetical protein
MKSKYSLAILVLAISSSVFAAPNLLTIAEKELIDGAVDMTKMTPSAVAEFSGFRNYARGVKEAVFSDSHLLLMKKDALENRTMTADTPYDNFSAAHKISDGYLTGLDRDSELAVLAPTENQGRNGGLLQQMEISNKSGKMIRTGFEIPSTHEKPESTEISWANIGRSDGINSAVSVKRTYDLPNLRGEKVTLENNMTVRRLDDGKEYATSLNTRVTVKNGERTESIVEVMNGPAPRQISVTYKEHEEWGADHADADFKLPDEIKGQVVQVDANTNGSRITFRTTEGMEYVYAVQKARIQDPKSKTQYVFSQVSKTKIPGGVKSMLAKVKVFEGRQTVAKSAKGLDVDLSGGSK